MTAATPPAARRVPAEQLEGRWRWGWLFAGLWLLYLVQTLQLVLDNPHVALKVIGTLALVAFGAIYLWTFWYVRLVRREMRQVGLRRQVVTIAAMVLLIVVTVLIAGEPALVMATFLVVIVLFLLPTRPALIASALILIAVMAVQRVSHGGWTGDDAGVIVGILTAALAVYGITRLIQRNAQLDQARRELAALAVAEERERLARDLHDILGHSLTVLAVKAELAGRLVRLDAERAEREIGEVERLARDALADVRAAVSGFRETSLAGELVTARAALDVAGIEAELPGAVDHVPGERRELFGWAVREGVTNVIRHSGARRCRVVVQADGVEVSDDGRGPVADPDARHDGEPAQATGHGLAGLRERAAAAGAAVTVGRSADGGFRLRVGW
jgi:two-component system sensor histidine kinase DesK